jgi:hypothetical protein
MNKHSRLYFNVSSDSFRDAVPKAQVEASSPIGDAPGATWVKTIIIVKMLLAEWLKW